MHVEKSSRTTALIEEARKTCERTNRAMDELERASSEAEETVSYFKWWRFLGYDPAAVDFLEKLDMHN
ncbi:MAG TPA: hypothetical protein VMZ26_01135 [Pyrinomonadaceae bacterium]|nr:hypothetical protein [Pyrinomonadaceae bacterium]